MILDDFGLAWRNLRARPLQTLIPVVVVGLAIALSVAVITLADAAEEGIVLASDPFGVLVIGPEGSGQQLVLSTILLQGPPIGNIPYSVAQDLQDDPRARLVVPLALGDSVNSIRIIGTTMDFFELRRSEAAPPAFALAEGRFFTWEDHDHEDADHKAEGEATAEADHEDEGPHILEAVLGAEAAARLGLTLGDQFRGTHGVGLGIAENMHEDIYEVVGILGRSQTAYDNAIYVALEAVWEVHAEETTERLDVGVIDGLSAPNPELGIAPEQVTAVLVKPLGFVEQNQIFQDFYVAIGAQAVFPGQELGALLSLISDGQRILSAVGYLVLGIAALTVFLAMYQASFSQQTTLAILRSLGASRATLARVILFETFLITLLGTLLGRILGYSTTLALANSLGQQSAIPLPLRLLPELEALLLLIAVGVALLAGLLPAWRAYRLNVVEQMFGS